MCPNEMTVIVTFTRRPLWKCLLRFPGAWKAHYKLLSKELSLLERVYASFLLGSMIIKVK